MVLGNQLPGYEKINLGSGVYPTTKIEVALPIEALSKTEENTLICQAYINVVMNSTQQFFVVLTDISEGALLAEAPNDSSTEEETTTVVPQTQEVPPVVSQYTEPNVDWDNSISYVIIGGFLGAIFLLALYIPIVQKRRREIYDWHYE